MGQQEGVRIWSPTRPHEAVQLRDKGGPMVDESRVFGRRYVAYGVIKGTERAVFPGDGIKPDGMGGWVVIPRTRIGELS